MEDKAKKGLQFLEKGREAVEKSDYTAAMGHYDDASSNLSAALTYARTEQASACVHAERFAAALVAADAAIKCSSTNAQAHYWRAVSLRGLGRHKDAAKSFRKAAEHERKPATKALYGDEMKKSERDAEPRAEPAVDAVKEEEDMDISAPLAPAAKGMPKDPGAPRLEWYQSAAFVSVDLLAKNCDEPKCEVEITQERMRVKLVFADGKPEYTLDRELAECVVPEKSSWHISKFKVELKLKKERDGVKWVALDKDATVASAAVVAGAAAQKRKEAVKQQQRQLEVHTEKELEGYKEDDSAMSVFRQIYAASDEDTKRAMMKSYRYVGACFCCSLVHCVCGGVSNLFLCMLLFGLLLFFLHLAKAVDKCCRPTGAR